MRGKIPGLLTKGLTTAFVNPNRYAQSVSRVNGFFEGAPKPPHQDTISLCASVPARNIPEWFGQLLADSTRAEGLNSPIIYRSRSKDGIPMLRDATMEHYQDEGFNVANCSTFFSISVHQTLARVADTALDKGDEILMVAPTFGLFFTPLYQRGFNIKIAKLTEESDFKITPEILSEMLQKSPEAKLFIFINPDNPTGKSYVEEEVQELAKILIAHNAQRKIDGKPPLIVFSDEVSKHISLRPDYKPSASIGAVPGMEEFTITVDSLSKTLAPGLGLSYAIGPKWLVEGKMLNTEMDFLAADYGPPQSIQYAAAQILTTERGRFKEHLLDSNMDYGRNLNLVTELVERLNVSLESAGIRNGDKKSFELVTVPDGGLQCLVRASGLLGCKFSEQDRVISDDIILAEYLRRDLNVKILPAQSCGFDPEDVVFRTTYSKEPEKLITAFDRITDHLKSLTPPSAKILPPLVLSPSTEVNSNSRTSSKLSGEKSKSANLPNS